MTDQDPSPSPDIMALVQRAVGASYTLGIYQRGGEASHPEQERFAQAALDTLHAALATQATQLAEARAEVARLRAAIDGERCGRCGGSFHPDRLMRWCGRCNRWRSMPIVRAALASTDPAGETTTEDTDADR